MTRLLGMMLRCIILFLWDDVVVVVVVAVVCGVVCVEVLCVWISGSLMVRLLVDGRWREGEDAFFCRYYDHQCTGVALVYVVTTSKSIAGRQ